MKYDVDKFVSNLSGMVKIPTVSSADPEKTDVPAFLELHKYLEKTWPLVHNKMKREVIGRCGLLYTWKGTGKSDKLPLVMTAHQDVVPEGDHSMWKHPPYSGEVAEGFLWGRGATDSKCNIQAYMDALEMLIEDGFEPDYDLYFAFGYNEEVMGGPEPAALLIAEEMKRRGIKIGCLIDECGGIEMRDGKADHACIYTSEKGYADFKFTAESAGGHSATPVAPSALGEIADTIKALETKLMDPVLTEAAVQQLEGTAKYMTDPKMAELCKDVRKNWKELLPLLTADRLYNALCRTTTAVTMAGGSAQANIIAERAWIVANNRMLPGQTIDDLWAHFKKIVPEGVKIELVKGTNPPPIQSTDTYAYHLIESIVQEMYPGVQMIPHMLYGGTDSRYYTDLCDTESIYRFTGLQYDPRWRGVAHKVNERIPVDILAKNVEFYVHLFQKYGK